MCLGPTTFRPPKSQTPGGLTPSSRPDLRVLRTPQCPVPAKNCLWRHKRTNVPKHLAAQGLSLGGQTTTLVVGEPDPLALQMLPEHPILFCQIGDNVLLLLIQPPGQCKDDQLPCMKDYDGILLARLAVGQVELGNSWLHAPACYCRTSGAAEYWDHTPWASRSGPCSFPDQAIALAAVRHDDLSEGNS